MRGAALVAGAALALAGCNPVLGLDEPRLGPHLDGLVPSSGVLVPAFAPDVEQYRLEVSMLAQALTLRPVGADGQTVRIAGDTVTLGTASPPLELPRGPSAIEVVVTAPHGVVRTYRIDVDRGAAAPVARRLASTAPVMNGNFGYAIDADGDRLAIGAYAESPHGLDDCDGPGGGALVPNVGAVYVYRRTADGYALEQRLEPPADAACTHFGGAVALDGDRLVVGDPLQRVDVNLRAGAVYVYAWDGAAWGLVTRLTSANQPANGRFGHGVAADDGWVAVGAPGIGGDAGQVVLYTGADLSTQAVVAGHAVAAGSQLGYAVELDRGRLVASAPGHSDVVANAGSVGVYERAGTTWNLTRVVRAPQAVLNEYFGVSLSLDGDRLAVGSPLVTSATGRARFFVYDGTAWIERGPLGGVTPEGADLFGNVVSAHRELGLTGWCGGDVSLAGWAETPPPTGGPISAGAALVYDLTVAPPALLGAMGRDAPVVNGLFGCINALTADRMILGAHGEPDGAIAGAGGVYVVE